MLAPLACAPSDPCGPYGLMTFALGFLVGAGGRAGVRLAVLLTLALAPPGPAIGAQRTAAQLSIIVPGAPGARAIMGSAPIHLLLSARLYDPRHEFLCPTWEWIFGDGARSEREDTSCDPYAPEDTHPTEYRPHGMVKHAYRVGGTYRLELIVRAQGREIRASRDVRVLGLGLSLEDVGK